MTGGSAWSVFGYWFYEDGALVEGDGFGGFGTVQNKTFTFNKGPGTYTYRYEFGDMTFGHGFVTATVEIIVIVQAFLVEVETDLKPGDDPNIINLGAQGVIPVAILSAPDFDAGTVDAGTVELAGADVAVRGRGNVLASLEDVNGDGLLDLLCQVETENLDPDQIQNGVVCLTDETFDGQQIVGCDEILIVPPEP